MSTDRELLELAAKAAGIKIVSHTTYGPFVGGVHDGEIWNPLTDDGDALRLAVKLQITVFQLGATRLCEDVTGAYLSDEVDAEGDGLAATRRAIVRAAVDIGQNV